MSALDDAVKAAMDEAGCELTQRMLLRWCFEHDDAWNTDRDECSVVGSAVRAGWAAAIDAALARLGCAASDALAGTGPGCGDEAYERAVNAARIAYGDAHSAVRALRLPEGDQP